MNQSEITKRIAEICNEFDIRVKDVGAAVARLELAKTLADCEASQQASRVDRAKATPNDHYVTHHLMGESCTKWK